MGFSRRPVGGGGGGRQLPVFPQIDTTGVGKYMEQYAVQIRYWKAMACPCANDQSGQANLACAQCRGLGWFHTSVETDAIFSRAIITSRRSQKRQDAGGRVTSGGVSITLLPGVIPGDGDLIQACADREVVNSEHLTVGGELTDGSTAESLRFRDVECVERVLVWDPLTKRSSELPAARWSFDPASRAIKTDLARGAKYSVRYIARPEFIVKAETAQPLLRIAHDGGELMLDPGRKDLILPFNVEGVRLDRAILQKLRGAVDLTEPSTFNNTQRGPFR